MDRGNLYEAAFEAYLRRWRWSYIAVDETRRSFVNDCPTKSLDFIVHGPAGVRLLIDVKGRRYPGGTAEKPRYVWENWATREDLEGMMAWCQRFGPDYTAAFVFGYRLGESVELPFGTPDQSSHNGDRFLWRAVTLDDYQRKSRIRSPKWGTVFLRQDDFRAAVRPFGQLLAAGETVDTLRPPHPP